MSVETKISSAGILADRTMMSLLLGVCIERLGGNVSFTQKDIDSVAYKSLLEHWGETPEGAALVLTVADRQVHKQ